MESIYISSTGNLTLNLENSTLHELGHYEKWLDFSKNLVEDPSTIGCGYRIKGYEKGPLLHRKDEGNLIKFNYYYNNKERENINKSIEKLLKKLHPDTRKSVTLK